MTFFAPEFGDGTGKTLPQAFPASLFWQGWFESSKPQTFLEDAVAMQRELASASLSLMLLPFTIFGTAAPGGSAPKPSESAAATQAKVARTEAVAPMPAPKPAPPAPAVPETPPPPVAASPASAAPTPAVVDDVDGVAPALYAKPEGKPDDLLVIKGIGPKLNQLLNSLGVWHYRQIVSWTPAEVAWVNAKIDFKGRIQRERWQAQAAALLKRAKGA